MKHFQRTTYSMIQSRKGNVLFIILIAVALFAALSYAVSGSMRGGGETIGKQQAGVAAGDILRSMQGVQEAYIYLMNQGCSIDDIAVDNPASTNLPCQIFHPQGAGVNYPSNLAKYQIDPNVANDGKFAFVSNIGVTNLGTSATERMVTLNYVQSEVCEAVNKQLNLGLTSVPAADAAPTYGDGITAFAGKTAGCHAASNNQIWFVLLEL